MNTLHAGFARVNITPLLGAPLAGYFHTRISDGVLDQLEANALALSLGETKLVIIAVDHLGIERCFLEPIRENISKAANVPLGCIFVSCTHTHTAPDIRESDNDPIEKQYLEFLKGRLTDAAVLAFADLKPAKMGFGVGQAQRIAFERRYRMKDGSLRTNPGVNRPDIDAPIGEPDERVSVLRFDREGGTSIVLTHFGVHPDTVGGCKISADWPGFVRRTVERALPNTSCLLINGCEGDINHCNSFPQGGDMNDLTVDFDDVNRGYGHARHMGQVIAGAVLQVYDKVCYTPVTSLAGKQALIDVPANLPDPKDLPRAREYSALHNSGRDSEIPYQGMMLTTVVAEAERMLRLEHGPESFPLPMSVVAMGDVALVGIPGEPFAAIGFALRDNNPEWKLVLPCAISNGYEGYFPSKSAYTEGGYEVRTSIFASNVADRIVEEGRSLLDQVKAGA